MSTTQDLPDHAKALIGLDMDLGMGVDEVCRPMVRYWCEALEDANPIYTDAAFARTTTYGDVIAPSPLAASFCRLPFWPVPDRPGAQAGLIGHVGAVLNCPENVVQRCFCDFYKPPRLGDHVRCVERVTQVSPQKMTHLGTGHFVTLERRYYNQHDELISAATLPFWKYQRGSPRKEAVPDAAPLTMETVTASCRPIARSRDVYETLLWEDVQEGEALPPVSLHLSVTRMVMLAFCSRDFNPVHHDMEQAQASGAPHMFLQWTGIAGFLSRFLTDWAGPSAWIKRLVLHLQRMNCAHETMTSSGRVVRKYRENGQDLVEIELLISNDVRGPTTPGSALVVLP